MIALLRRALCPVFFSLLCFFLCVAGQTATATAQQPSTYILWPSPDPVSFLSPLTGLQLDAIALTAPPVSVSLEGNFNVAGLATPGTPFVGGFDGNGESLSAAQFSTSLQWHGVTFALGAPDTLDVVSGGTVPLPSGAYSSLWLLADLVNDEKPGNRTIVVHYTDGTTSSVTQAFSDWVRARNNSGESTVTCVPNRVYYNGAVEPNSTCVYGYRIPLDSTKGVLSVDLPDDRNIVVLSMALLPPVVPGTYTYSPAAGSYPPEGTSTLSVSFIPDSVQGATNASVSLTVNPPPTALKTSLNWPQPTPVSVGTLLGPAQLDATATAFAEPVMVPLLDAARVNAFYHDGTSYRAKGFDGNDAAFSFQQLGSALQYKGASFPLLSPDVQNAATSSTIQLPAGNYSTLYLLGAAAGTDQLAQVFTLHYADGTSSSQSLDLSSWTSSTTYADETVVASTTMQNLADGTQRASVSRVYGYSLSVDATRVVKSVALPDNPQVILLAAALSTGQTAPVDGSYKYSPAAGTAMTAGDTPLHVDFTPGRPDLETAASDDVVIHALRPLLTIRALDAQRVYGTPNPTFNGTITGAIGRDSFIGSYTTSATPLSPTGTYAIIPTVQGDNVSGYQVQTIPATLTVTQAASVASLSSAQASALQGSSIALTAIVNSATTGVPTGSVTFFVNGVASATRALVNGSATLVTTTLPVGSVQVTVTYGGNQNFLPSSTASANLFVTPRDFLLTANHGNVLTGTMGSSPTLQFRLTPLNGLYSDQATFAVSGDLPNQTYATFTPGTLAEDGGIADIVMTLHTRKYAEVNNPFERAAQGVSLAALLGFLPIVGLRRRGRLYRLCAALLAAFVLFGATGCGTGYAAHAYSFQLTATTGTVSHSVPLTLQIQASSQ